MFFFFYGQGRSFLLLFLIPVGVPLGFTVSKGFTCETLLTLSPEWQAYQRGMKQAETNDSERTRESWTVFPSFFRLERGFYVCAGGVALISTPVVTISSAELHCQCNVFVIQSRLTCSSAKKAKSLYMKQTNNNIMQWSLDTLALQRKTQYVTL